MLHANAGRSNTFKWLLRCVALRIQFMIFIQLASESIIIHMTLLLIQLERKVPG